MNKLLKELQNEFQHLQGNIQIPKEIELLYQWIEKHGLIEATDGLINTPNGTFGNPDIYHYGRISADYEFNPDITFSTNGQRALKHWFNLPEVTNEISSRLVVFADSGYDGSLLAFWVNDNNELKFVHMGSGSGSMLCCIIANSAKEFLSLLSIGYGQLGDVFDFSLSPEEIDDEEEIKINHEFVEWLDNSFGIKRLHDAGSIIKETPQIGDENTNDPFCLWCNKQFPQ
ncbi:hypothetical protein HC231_00660 [Brenneria izadpanahii]|uniref:SMI1/KNR4 family protein n=1 Tax=Brenneria izadpanahii TaxID=2722756 RepID=A0ABX7UM57_9GAMM|nr:hypothetical protein [Brenneria izadpanahii]QTF06608.1 hypothetical protein HC231_00660 [Brenneria izadpanahii]